MTKLAFAAASIAFAGVLSASAAPTTAETAGAPTNRPLPKAAGARDGRDASRGGWPGSWGEQATGWLESRDGAGWIANRLEAGLRVVHATADTTYRWNEELGSGFLGTIARLDDADRYQFNNIVLAYKLTDWIAIGATWDQIAEIAVTHTADSHRDGEWKERGPTLSAILTTPRLFGFVSPYAELGMHVPDASFDAYPWWSLGYPSQARYEAARRPGHALGGYRRFIEAHETDAITLAWGLGFKVYVTERFALDFAYRHIDCDLTAHFWLERGGRLMTDQGWYDIPLSYSQVCAGIRWAF